MKQITKFFLEVESPALSTRDELHQKVRATVKSAVQKTFSDSIVIFVEMEYDYHSFIEYPSISS